MQKKIIFQRQPIPKDYGKAINNIYFVVEGGKSKVKMKFNELTKDEKDIVKSLICKMATEENFASPKLKNNLHGYNFGEIKPSHHRFFFFQKCGNNIIFFDYISKKRNSLGDAIYKQINKLKEKYEQEFQKYYEPIR